METIGEVLGKKDLFTNNNVFNLGLEYDSRYYLNIGRIRVCDIPEFSGSFNKIVLRIQQIIYELSLSNGHDIHFDQALSLLPEGDLNEICLGYSLHQYGKGIGEKTKRDILDRAKAIIDSGNSDPNIFFLMPLFTSGVGADRLSDIFGNIIVDDIRRYTQRIMREFSINIDNHPDQVFSDWQIHHPRYRNKKLLFVPLAIIHELPNCKEFIYINSLYSSNQYVRDEVNRLVGESWSDFTQKMRKDVLFELLKRADFAMQLSYLFQESRVNEYDVTTDIVGDIYLQKHLNDYLDIHRVQIDYARSPRLINNVDILIRVLEEQFNNHDLKTLFSAGEGIRGKEFAARLIREVLNNFASRNGIDITVDVVSNSGVLSFTNNSGEIEKIYLRYLKNKKIVQMQKSVSDKNAELGSIKYRYFIVLCERGLEAKKATLLRVFEDIKAVNPYCHELKLFDI